MKKDIFKPEQRPDPNAIVLVYLGDLANPEVAKYHDGQLTLTDGKTRRNWSDVVQWRYSDVEDTSALIVPDKTSKAH